MKTNHQPDTQESGAITDVSETLPVEEKAETAPKSSPDDDINVHMRDGDHSQISRQSREPLDPVEDLSLAPLHQPRDVHRLIMTTLWTESSPIGTMKDESTSFE